MANITSPPPISPLKPPPTTQLQPPLPLPLPLPLRPSPTMPGQVSGAAWIRRPDRPAALAAVGRPAALDVFAFDPKCSALSPAPRATFAFEEDGGGELVGVAVHPGGDEIVCSTTAGCRLLELLEGETNLKLVPKDLPLLKDVGPQKCLVFSPDGSMFAIGGKDGHLRIFQWPSLHILLDEPQAHKSVQDMDFSLDSEYLASTSVDGSARVWSKSDRAPLTTLSRDSEEKIGYCRFSRDGTKPFLFCTTQKGAKSLLSVWDISTWNKIGHKKLLQKPASVLSISADGKYLSLGSMDGDLCAVEVKKMQICHWSRQLHLGTSISSIEFCPTERVVLSTSKEWGATVTKLNVPADWKEWQIYLLLLGLFLASALLFYIFFKVSDSFWNFPLGGNQPRKHEYGGTHEEL